MAAVSRRGGVVGDEDLRQATEDLYYEWSMLAHGFDALEQKKLRPGDPPRDDLEQAVYNGLIESFGLHARIVVDFLRVDAEDAGKNDVVAADYPITGGPSGWRAPLEAEKEFVDSERDKFNRKTAHIRRASKGGGRGAQFQYRRMLTAITRSLKLFIDRLPPHLVHERWTPKVRQHLADQVRALDQLKEGGGGG